VLDELHLLGKKAGEFRIWRDAVTVWSQTQLRSARWPLMEELSMELHARRRPAATADYTWVDINQGYLEGFLAGFASAEGHFGASAHGHPRFVIKLRVDDSAILALLASRFRVGRLEPVPRRSPDRPQMAWLVTKLDDLRLLVSAFDRRPPLGRAGRIYPSWRQLVLGTDRRRATARRICALRRYRTPVVPATRSSGATKLERYASVLERWARQTGPPYTATSYEMWRRSASPRSPNRNTLARTFGSWRKALKAGGLSVDGARSAETTAKSRDRAATRRAELDRRRREGVLRAVDRCSAALGEHPSATEFLRWRLRNAPESPSQASIYRLFPGGWQAVLGELERSARGDRRLQPPPQPLHVRSPPREELARKPQVEAGSADQLGHEGVAGHEVAAGQRE
jgi:hypothetical protein